MKKITLAIVLLLVIVAGCRKEDVFTSELLDTQMSEREIFKYSKTIEVFDKERKNSIVLKISTNSKERLQQELSKKVELIPLYLNNEEKEEIRKEYSLNDSVPPNMENGSDVVNPLENISIDIIETKFVDDITSYEIKSTREAEPEKVRISAACTNNGFWQYSMTTYNQQYATIKSTNYRIYANLYSQDGVSDFFWDYRDYAEVCKSLCNGQRKTLYSSVKYKLKLTYNVSKCNSGTDWTVSWGRFY